MSLLGSLEKEEIDQILDQWSPMELAEQDVNPDQIRSLDKLAGAASENQRRIGELQKTYREASLNNDKDLLAEVEARLLVRQIRSSRFIRRRDYLKKQKEKREAIDRDQDEVEVHSEHALIDEGRKIKKSLAEYLSRVSVAKSRVGRADRYSPEHRDMLALERVLSGAVELLSRAPQLK